MSKIFIKTEKITLQEISNCNSDNTKSFEIELTVRLEIDRKFNRGLIINYEFNQNEITRETKIISQNIANNLLV